MALDSQDKRRSVVWTLPVADSSIDANDRRHVPWVYRGPLASGIGLFKDTHVTYVRLDLLKKSDNSTDTYYLGREFWDAGDLYASSPKIYPLLASEPVVRRGVGKHFAKKFRVDIEIHGLSDFDTVGNNFISLLDTHIFTEQDIII